MDEARLAALEARLAQATSRVEGVLVALCAAQQLLLVAGATLFQAGVVQPKNVSSVLVKSLIDAALAGLAWWLLGYAMAFGPTEGGFATADRGNFALRDVEPGRAGWDRFLWTYGAVTVSSTIFGRAAYSERASLLPSMIFTFLSAAFVFPVLVHWTWGEGWLSAWGAHPNAAGAPRPMLSGSADSNGMIDASGCGVVHVAGACMALAGTTIVGPRAGRWAIGVRSDAVEYGNKTLQYLGTLLLWFASYAVYLAPIILYHESSLAGQAVINITLSAVGGCLGAALLCAAAENTIDVTVVLNGVAAGLVAVSANLAVVLPWHAFLTGLVGSAFFYAGRRLLWSVHIDDPCDTISVHGFAGVWGLWAVGVFCTDDNVAAAGHLNANGACKRGEQFGVQVVGSLGIMCWSLCSSAFILGTMRVCRVPLRVSDEIEVRKRAGECESARVRARECAQTRARSG
jgi:Amt family ammonium transporter